MKNEIVLSCQQITSNPCFCHIHPESFEQLHSYLDPLLTDVSEFSNVDWHNQVLNPKEADEHCACWILVVSSLNFCFWLQDGSAYTHDYNSTTYSGYWSLAAMIADALYNGIDLTDFRYLDLELDFDTYKRFCFKDNIQLFKKRYDILKEIGSGMRIFNYDVKQLIRKANNSAVELYKLISRVFPSFDDRSFITPSSKLLEAAKFQAEGTVEIYLMKRA